MPNFAVGHDEIGQRLDRVLAQRFPERSRVFWQQQISSGQVLVNDYPAKPRHPVAHGDHVTYPNLELKNGPVSLVEATGDSRIEIIYEDDQVLVVNKPSGLVTHPAYHNTTDSVVQRILLHDPSVSQAVYDPDNPMSLLRPGVVHRLDKDTSGVLIMAKTKAAMSVLAAQIQNRRVTKIYTALLFGWLTESPLTVHTWLNRDPSDRRKMHVTEQGSGRESQTLFTIDKLLSNHKGDRVTLTAAQPITGRTHQIRVHASFIHHPVIGDQLYGFNESDQLSTRLGLGRQFLHASSLSIRLPGQVEPTTFTAPLPDDLKHVLNQFS